MKIDILGLGEIRSPGAGCVETEGSQVKYPGGDAAQRGVGILVSKAVYFMGYWVISGRIILVKLRERIFNSSIMQIYAPKKIIV